MKQKKSFSIFIEFTAMIAVILTVGFLLRPYDPFLTQIHPHPFWGVVLLLALRYGNPAGTLVGVTCCLLHLTRLVLQGFRVEEAIHLGSPELVPPILYIIAGTFIADRTQRNMGIVAHFKEQADILRQRVEEGESKTSDLEQAYRELEGQIAGQTDTLAALYASAKRLDSPETEDVEDILLHTMREYLRVEQASIWSVDDNENWKLLAGSPGTEGKIPHLGRVALQEKRVINSPADLKTEHQNPEDGLLAGIIPLRQGRETLVVIIHAIPFHFFTRRTIRLFNLLLDWTGRALERQQFLTSARNRDVFNIDLGLTSEVFFRTNVIKEMALVRRRQETSCLLFCRIDEGIPQEARQRLNIVMAAILRELVRRSDTAAYFAEEDLYALHMPTLALAGAAVVERKIIDCLEQFDIHPYGDERGVKIRCHTVMVDAEIDFDQILKTARHHLESTREKAK